MQKIRLILFFLSTFHFTSISQNIIHGIVSDIGTRTPIQSSSIYQNGRLITNSNSEGEFKFNKNIPSPENSLGCYIFQNSIYWTGVEKANFTLYSTDGKEVLSSQISNHARFQLPTIPIGYYFLNITPSNNSFSFILFSDGQNIIHLKKKGTISPFSLQNDSLSFSKNGYFDRTINISNNYNIRTSLLKKNYSDLDYFHELLRKEAFTMLQSNPPVTNYGEVKSVKVLYDFEEDKIYYFNAKKHKSHFNFAKNILGYKGNNASFFNTQYGNSSQRFSYLITINYHKNIDKYVFNFSAKDLVDCDGVKAIYEKVLKTSYLGDKLVFYINNPRWNNCTDIPTISSEALFLGQNYQALNLGKNYGFLRKIDQSELETTSFGKHDIALLNTIPNDISLVSGIITTEFQTPLSHINILSHNRKIPNMALKNGWMDKEINSLIGNLVLLEVRKDSFLIRIATIEEANEHWEKIEPKESITLDIDTLQSGLLDLKGLNHTSVNVVGGKAANFAELINIGNIPVPENAFAIPFYYYQHHMDKNGITQKIQLLLQNQDFISNLNYRKIKLNEIRKLIVQSEVDSELISLVDEKINHFNDFSSFRFRSSTNAEDLENFSGAGLYDSYSAKKNHSKKTIERAIKKVWASLWNLRAFDERAYYKINQESIAMGILVHRSFPHEDANGVIITKNLYNGNHGYIINTQFKEYSIVYPEPGIINDQIIIYTRSLDENKYSIEYLSHSNIPEFQGKTVLRDEELFEIAEYCSIIKKHYFDNVPNSCNCDYHNFAVDIEFKLDSQLDFRKIYIKQVRIYN